MNNNVQYNYVLCDNEDIMLYHKCSDIWINCKTVEEYFINCDIIGIDSRIQLYFLSCTRQDHIYYLYHYFNEKTYNIQKLYADYFHWLISESSCNWKTKNFILTSYCIYIKNKFRHFANSFSVDLTEYNKLTLQNDTVKKTKTYKQLMHAKQSIYLCRDVADFMFKYTRYPKIHKLRKELTKYISTLNLDSIL